MNKIVSLQYIVKAIFHSKYEIGMKSDYDDIKKYHL